MSSEERFATDHYHGVNLIADPIHRYIPITYPRKPGEPTERDLIDSPWVQRLRRIHQLQSAWWVYPGAEHSRFVHSLGVMHCGAFFVKALYASLKRALESIGEHCPSLPCVEETVRAAGLLHDVGHGPFCHFFDEKYLSRFGITHEDLSQRIITGELGERIAGLRRSPSGEFEEGERVEPRFVAFLIKKPASGGADEDVPAWVRFLRPLFCGIFTVDNIDYTLRDAYMCGISTRFVDMDRLCHYTFYNREGLVFHQSGLSALEMFLKSRWYLYNNVYYHRTVRGIDLQLGGFFADTIDRILGGDPRDRMDAYLDLTDYSLFETVRRWRDSSDAEERRLAESWRRIMERRIVWKMVFEKEIVPRGIGGERARGPDECRNLEEAIRSRLPAGVRDEIEFKVDMARHDPRPINPYLFQDEKLRVYYHAIRHTEERSVNDLFPHLPGIVAHVRVYSRDGMYADELNRAAGEAIAEEPLEIGFDRNTNY